MAYYLEKLKELLKRRLSEIIAQEVELPLNTLATILKVELDSEKKLAKVYLSIFPKSRQQDVLNQLNREKGRIKFSLSKKIIIKRIPELEFIINENNF